MSPMPPTANNAGQAFARVLADEMIRHGVRHACIAPGSRSAPLALALAEREEIALHVQIDERSASFLALGIAKAGGVPALLVTTSGTAAAEAHAALLEAHHARVPMIVLTADRPPELRATGAPQTIDQTKLYGDAARFFADAGVPEARAHAVRYWRSLASRAFSAATGAPNGPVHLNVPLRDPLHGVADEHGFPYPLEGRADGEPWTAVQRAGRMPHDRDIEALIDIASRTERGLIVAGDGAFARRSDADPLGALARAWSWPVIAEPSSGARTGDHVVSAAEALLRDPNFSAGHRPDVVLRIGRLGSSKTLLSFLDPAIDQIAIDPDGGWLDPDRAIARVIDAEPWALCEALAKGLARSSSPWLESWMDAERRARAAIDAALDADDEPFEGRIARDLAAMLPSNATLVVASSMPVRDLDWFMAPRPGLRVLANRGANGIDGFVSTVLGVTLANADGPTFALAGDLSMLHDANGFLVTRHEHASAVFVVLNNDGGGIFSFLPYAGDDRFERLFATPQHVDFEAFASFHGLGYGRVERADDLMRAVLEARGAGGVQIVEVRTDRERNVAKHRAVWEAVSRAL